MKNINFARECPYCGAPLDDNGACSNNKCGNQK